MNRKTSTDSSDSSDLKGVLTLGSAALLAMIIMVTFWGFSYDDAFITYRYADQWAQGNALVFNEGETVYGTTAPGWALMLGGVTRLSRSLGLGWGPPEWGTLGSFFALWWMLACLPYLWLKRFTPHAASFTLVLAVVGLTYRWNLEMIGSEFIPATAFVLTSLGLAITRRQYAWAGLAMAAAMFFRLDTALAAGVLGLYLWYRHRRFPWRFASTGLFFLGLYLGWIYSVFGVLTPHTLSAKQGESAFGAPYSTSQWKWFERAEGGAYFAGLFFFLVLLSLVILWRRRKEVLILQDRLEGAAPEIFQPGIAMMIFGTYVLLLELFYRLVGVAFAPWYHLGLIYFLLVALAALPFLQPIHGSWVRWWKPLFSMGLIVLTCPQWMFLAQGWGQPPDPRYLPYRQLAESLASETTGRQTVASTEVGILAYFSDYSVLDLTGLMAPELALAKEKGHVVDYVLQRKPEFLVAVPHFMNRELGDVMRSSAFKEQYHRSQGFESPFFGELELWRRNSSQCGPMTQEGEMGQEDC